MNPEHAVFECQQCGFILRSDNEEEITQLSELYDAGVLVCPICKSRNFRFYVRGMEVKNGLAHE